MSDSVNPVTTRYAEALFRLALRSGQLANVQTDVERLSAEVENERVSAFLFDARVPVEKRQASLQGLLSGLSPLVRNFVNLLFDKRRENVLRGLRAAWRRRSLAERGAVEGTVESARPLGPGEIAELGRVLGSRLGLEVQLENEVVPELLAGVRVTVGGRMLDNTAVGRLEGLRRRMLDAQLASAQG